MTDPNTVPPSTAPTITSVEETAYDLQSIIINLKKCTLHAFHKKIEQKIILKCFRQTHTLNNYSFYL